MSFSYGEQVDIKKGLDRDEKRAKALLNAGEQMTVKEILAESEQLFGDKTMREVLHSLEDKGHVRLVKREGKGGRLVYERII